MRIPSGREPSPRTVGTGYFLGFWTTVAET
jgi:hypothetical protein